MAPVRLPGTSPRELLTVAVTGGSPTASSTGKVTRVPDPTTALIPPAANPAAATATISHPVMRPSPGSLARGRSAPSHLRRPGDSRRFEQRPRAHTVKPTALRVDAPSEAN